MGDSSPPIYHFLLGPPVGMEEVDVKPKVRKHHFLGLPVGIGQIDVKPKVPKDTRSRDRRDRSRSPARRGSRYDDRSRSPSRDRDRDYDRRDRRRDAPPSNGNNYDDRASRPSRDPHHAEKSMMATNTGPRDSQQDRRVYVGNLSYDVKWHHLKDHMKQDNTLEVLFADVLLLPNGMSKGCGIVEYATRDQAQTAINTLSNTPLMGRLIYVREDRETESRPPQAQRGGFGGGFGGRGGFQGPYGGGPGMGMHGGGMHGGMHGGMQGGGMGGPGRQIFVSNLPFSVGWQDLKDLFRQAGNVARADVHTAPDGTAKGSGVVAFETPDDAQNAIQHFNGYDWQGRILEVREDRYAQSGGFGGRGGFGRGGFGGRGGFHGGRGGFQGGFNGPYGGGGGFGGGYGGGRGGYGGGGYGGGGGGFGGGHGGAAPGASAANVPTGPNPFIDGVVSGGEPSATIHVKNLPWSTSNEDLIELFITIGNVDKAEIQYEPNGRSRGTGVVLFGSQQDAATAIEKFQGYAYGGRPLGLDYARYPGTDSGGAMEGQEQSIQEQMM